MSLEETERSLLVATVPMISEVLERLNQHGLNQDDVVSVLFHRMNAGKHKSERVSRTAISRVLRSIKMLERDVIGDIRGD